MTQGVREQLTHVVSFHGRLNCKRVGPCLSLLGGSWVCGGGSSQGWGREANTPHYVCWIHSWKTRVPPSRGRSLGILRSPCRGGGCSFRGFQLSAGVEDTRTGASGERSDIPCVSRCAATTQAHLPSRFRRSSAGARFRLVDDRHVRDAAGLGASLPQQLVTRAEPRQPASHDGDLFRRRGGAVGRRRRRAQGQGATPRSSRNGGAPVARHGQEECEDVPHAVRGDVVSPDPSPFSRQPATLESLHCRDEMFDAQAAVLFFGKFPIQEGAQSAL